MAATNQIDTAQTLDRVRGLAGQCLDLTNCQQIIKAQVELFKDKDRERVKHMMRQQLGLKLLDLLEDGRDYEIKMYWEERDIPERHFINPNDKILELAIFPLLRDPHDAKVGELVSTQKLSSQSDEIIVPILKHSYPAEHRKFVRRKFSTNSYPGLRFWIRVE